MFDAKKVTEGIIRFIRNYYRKNNLKGVVLGISGGKDSAVVAGLFTRALGAENVVGLTLPCHSKTADTKDAKLVSKHFGFRLFNLDLTSVFDTFEAEFKKSFEFDLAVLNDSNINLKPRLRMAAAYYVAAAFSNFERAGFLVAGTSNACELYVGYFTKGGDNVHDISVLADLTVEEVIKVGEYIGVPLEILYKEPSDGLSNLSDEEKLAVKYKEIAKVINDEPVEEAIYNRIALLNKRNKHKFKIPKYKKSKTIRARLT